MKHFTILFLSLLSFSSFSQESWVRVEVQPDQYPSEITWEILNSAGTVLAVNPPFTDMSLQTTIIALDTEDYNFVIYDEFGDGICCAYGEGWFGLSNDCGLEEYVYDFGGVSATVFFTLEQCAQPPPPIVGCMDSTAVNFNPEAGQNSYMGQVTPTSCNSFYPSNYNYFGIALDYYNENQSVFAIGTEISVGGFTYYIDGTSTPNNCNAGVAMIYVVTDPILADGNLFDTMQVGALFTDLYEEDVWVINPCEYIYGCNNPLAINYDPQATSNDGSCTIISGCMDPTALNYNPAAVTEFAPGIPGPPPCQYFVLDTTSCGTDSVELIVEITVDQYANETSWNIITNWNEDQIVMEVLEGEYSDLTMGTTVIHTACVADDVNFTFRIFDSYGDGLGGAQWGGIDGEWIVYTACDTIASGGGNFGSNAMANGNTGDCDDLPIEGCMDDNYVEYNPEAVLDDGSCLTANIYGCIDDNSINYDTEANTAEQFSNCLHTLTLTDLSANGWGGSFLIVTQGESYYGPFTVASGEALFTIGLELNSNELIKAFFYTDPLSANFANECGFEIVSPSDEVVVFGGDNPILSPIRFSPFMYSGLGQCLETCIPIILGCTDDSACNFDPEANTLSSCTYNIEYYDCSNQCNSDIDGDGVCDELEVQGCQDPLQYNFNISATDSGECEPFVYGCTDNTMFNFDPEANTDNNSCIPMINGCTDPTAFNYDIFANVDNNTCIPPVSGCTDPSALNYIPEANIDDDSCIATIYGCTDPTAFNYNELANTNNDTCIEIVEGCTNPIALNYNTDANIDNFSCILPIYGCMDITALNYDENANVDNDTCIEIVEGCTNPIALNYNESANTDDFSCILPIYGCTNENSLNYDENANVDNNSCIEIVEGCTDINAINYNELANVDDFSCIDYIYGCTDSTALNYNELANTDNGTCIEIIEGCTDPLALNYNDLANVDDFSCILPIYGCTDPTAFNFNELANIDNGSCEDVVEGCTDPSAFNYNPEANTEDFSCIDVIYGCTDLQAANYDELANTDNGSCETVYANCIDPVVEAYNLLGLGNECFAWVINVSPSCCNNGWVEGCQELYNYCDLNNETTNINDFGETEIIVFPNPTRNVVNIASNLQINAVLYNYMGQPIFKGVDVKQIDMGAFSAGVYTLIITYNDLKFTKKIVKQ